MDEQTLPRTDNLLEEIRDLVSLYEMSRPMGLWASDLAKKIKTLDRVLTGGGMFPRKWVTGQNQVKPNDKPKLIKNG